MVLSPDVTELLVDPDLGAQEFTVRRRKGKWQGGRMEVVEDTTLTPTGIIQPTSAEDLQYFPEGERRKGMITIFTQEKLYLTEDKTSDISDDVIWQGEAYKVIKADRWEDYGYTVGYAAKR